MREKELFFVLQGLWLALMWPLLSPQNTIQQKNLNSVLETPWWCFIISHIYWVQLSAIYYHSFFRSSLSRRNSSNFSLISRSRFLLSSDLQLGIGQFKYFSNSWDPGTDLSMCEVHTILEIYIHTWALKGSSTLLHAPLLRSLILSPFLPFPLLSQAEVLVLQRKMLRTSLKLSKVSSQTGSEGQSKMLDV